jgi:predicted methyltransferase
MIRSFLLISAAALTLTACSGAKDKAADAADAAQSTAATSLDAAADSLSQAAETASSALSTTVDTAKLSKILAAQPEAVKARYNARHPQETLEFFEIKPGMTVVEVLPGGGWYTKIIGPYLGQNGHVIGVDYNLDMWPEFGGFATPEFIENRKGWAAGWEKDMTDGVSGEMSRVSGHSFSRIPDDYNGQVDMVLMIRALHNLARFNEKGGYMDTAFTELYGLLKPGGIVGIVQHKAPEGNDDSWADGNNGYLKKSYVIAQMEKAGFELVGESAVNENPRDIPSDAPESSDNVWRLPPTLGTSRENPELRSKMEAIGESSRMTLKFIKPAS